MRYYKLGLKQEIAMVMVRLFLEATEKDKHQATEEGLAFIFKDVEFDTVPRVGEILELSIHPDPVVTAVRHTPVYLRSIQRKEPGTSVDCSVSLDLIKMMLELENDDWGKSG